MASCFLPDFSLNQKPPWLGSVSFETWHPKVRFEHWNIFEGYLGAVIFEKQHRTFGQSLFSMLTLLTFKTTSSQYFGNISVQISPNDNKLDIFEIYTKRGVGKCPRWTFLTLRKPRKSINKWGKSFGGHPVLLHIFKIKDQKQKKLQNLLKFFGLIFQNVIVLVKLWHIFHPL